MTAADPQRPFAILLGFQTQTQTSVPDLISYRDFSKLRLDHFCAGEIAKTGAPIWEWMSGEWYCDAIGFTWFGRLNSSPNETGCLELDLSDLPQSESAAVLASLRLPLASGMNYDSVVRVLGEPSSTLAFVEDRKTYEFQAGSPETYQVSCTIQNDDGLIFVSVIRDDILQAIEAP